MSTRPPSKDLHRRPSTAATPAATPIAKSIAVALRHELAKPDAPRVVATGQGAIADKIVDVAFENGVKVRRDADLAGLLVAVDLHQEIPFAAFKAVAEILSRIYSHNGTLPAKRPGNGPVNGLSTGHGNGPRAMRPNGPTAPLVSET